MPVTNTDLILTPAPASTTYRLELEPAQNGLESLLLLNWVDEMSGYDEWVTKTAVSLPPELRHTNRLVTLGLHYAVMPRRSWSSFPAFVDHLAAQPPELLRDRIFDAYNHLPCTPPAADFDMTAVLATVGSFLDYLYSRFPPENIDVQIESEAYEYLKNPPAMQTLIVNHLRQMWQQVLQPEWEAKRPLLQACVDAFRQVDLSGLTPAEVVQRVTGKELPEHLQQSIEAHEITQVTFVPSAHIGPYLGKISHESMLWLVFGARQPDGLSLGIPDLSRSDLLVRLAALSDDTRLRIMHHLSHTGEKCAQEIIQELDLSQSAASRHLKQLSANGYLSERRREGGKCYSANVDRIEDTFHALLNFLQDRG